MAAAKAWLGANREEALGVAREWAPEGARSMPEYDTYRRLEVQSMDSLFQVLAYYKVDVHAEVGWRLRAQRPSLFVRAWDEACRGRRQPFARALFEQALGEELSKLLARTREYAQVRREVSAWLAAEEVHRS